MRLVTCTVSAGSPNCCINCSRASETPHRDCGEGEHGELWPYDRETKLVRGRTEDRGGTLSSHVPSGRYNVPFPGDHVRIATCKATSSLFYGCRRAAAAMTNAETAATTENCKPRRGSKPGSRMVRRLHRGHFWPG